MPRALRIILLILLVLTIATGVAYVFIKKEDETPLARKIMRDIPPRKEVEIFDLSNPDITLTLQKSGMSTAENQTTLAAELPAIVGSIHVKVGDTVEEGTLLVSLGNSTATDSLGVQAQSAAASKKIARNALSASETLAAQSIETAETNAKIALKAYKNALETRKITEKMLETQTKQAKKAVQQAEEQLELIEKVLGEIPLVVETAEAQYNQAVQALKQAELNAKLQREQLDFAVESAEIQYANAFNQIDTIAASGILQTLQAEGQLLQAETNQLLAEISERQRRITSPIRGTVTAILIKEGSQIVPGQPLIEIATTGDIQIETTVNQSEATLLKHIKKVSIRTESQKIEGSITSISPIPEQISKKIKITIMPKERSQITPGEFVSITFHLRPQKLYIPLGSIFLEDGSHFVWVVTEHGRVMREKVAVGEIVDNFAEITEGLSERQQIIKSTISFLSEGDQVIATTYER